MSDAKILIVDDERNVRSTLDAVLHDEGYGADAVDSGEAALEAMHRQAYDLILLDVWLPGMDGLEVLDRLSSNGNDAPVVMISGHGTIDTAVKATKLGAFDFIEKPLSLDRVLLVVANGLKQKALVEENRRLKAEAQDRVEIIGESTAIVLLRSHVERAAPSNGRVLVMGENGTGKELVARRIHLLSERSGAPFVEVNCAAIPEELIESELFGHVKGAFTNAMLDKPGKFSLADGGTLFLDEVGDMSLKTQAKVLRVLEEQRFQQVGSNETHSVDVRVIAATNKDLVREIEAGNFREDLYYRLNVIPIFVAPLRERRADITLLANRFLQDFAAEYGQPAKRFTPEAQQALLDHSWPGNVRELRNVCERLAIMGSGDTINRAELTPAFRANLPSDTTETANDLTLKEARELFERRVILAKLREHDGNVRQTAVALDVERSHLYRKMKAYGIDPSEFSRPR